MGGRKERVGPCRPCLLPPPTAHRHVLDDRLGARAVLEADGVADLCAQPHAHLLGDALRNRHRCDAARLRAADHAARRVPRLKQVLRELRRLARARLPDDDEHLVRRDGSEELRLELEDGQRLALLLDGQRRALPHGDVLADGLGLPLGHAGGPGGEAHAEVAQLLREVPVARRSHGVLPRALQVFRDGVEELVALLLLDLAPLLRERRLRHGCTLQRAVGVCDELHGRHLFRAARVAREEGRLLVLQLELELVLGIDLAADAREPAAVGVVVGAVRD